MKYNSTFKSAETLAAESYATMMNHYESMKRHIGEMVLEAIKSNNWALERDDAPELFDLIDTWQLDDAYILNAMNFRATLHSHRNRTGTRYENLSYEITF